FSSYTCLEKVVCLHKSVVTVFVYIWIYIFMNTQGILVNLGEGTDISCGTPPPYIPMFQGQSK
ncbi:hypothetical protein DPEC_G00004860, partial [Dallia pectoralis]